MMYLVKVLCADYNGEHIVGIFTSIAAAIQAVMDAEKEFGSRFSHKEEEYNETRLYFAETLEAGSANYTIEPIKIGEMYY